MPFPAYCATESARMRGVSMKDAIRRVHHLNLDDQGYKSKAQKALKDGIIRRLKQTEADDPIDGRSLESTSWMAVELYKRLMWRYAHDGGTPVTVNVYRGELTAEARNIMRNAAGADFHMIGGHGKTRLDRRHHAIDAAVIAMMTPAAAQAIATRISMHEAENLTGMRTDWRTCPANPTAKYQHWLEGMRRLMNLLNTALDDDRIRVLRNQRYRLGSSAAHKDTITPLTYRKLGDPLDASLIRHASTPALYTALTHLPDYNDADGLPADPERRINVNGTIIDSDDTIAFFTGDAAQILVNDGGAAAGSSIHHARVYRYYTLLKSGKRKYAYGWIRVYQQDLIHAHGDLFTEPLTACTLSLRYADQTLVSAIRDGRAEYLGHLLAGDEIVVDFTDGKGAVGKFNEFFAKDIREQPSAMRRWTVIGFPTLTQTSLRPCYLSGEGLAKLEERGGEPVPKEVEKILAGNGGYTPSVNTVFSLHPAIIHRNVFGEERWDTVSGLPTSWRVNDTQK